jgi:hypothetical protein
MAKDGKKRFTCDYCGIGSENRDDFKSCKLCKEPLCLFHRKPEAHACEAVDWESIKEEKGSGLSDLGVMDLLKAGAFVLAVLLIVRIVMGMIDGFGNLLRSNLDRAGRFAKANTAVFVAVPALLIVVASIFPGSADMVFASKDALAEAIDLDDMRLSLPQMPETDPLEDLKGCTKALSYASTLEDGEGQKCMSICKERGHASYGLVENGNSYDCYCCQGSGKRID